jgi:ankyrin repeat protein
LLDATCPFGRTALHWAASRGFDTLVQVLCDAGARLDVTTVVDGDDALILATQHGHTAVVQLLLEEEQKKIRRAQEAVRMRTRSRGGGGGSSSSCSSSSKHESKHHEKGTRRQLSVEKDELALPPRLAQHANAAGWTALMFACANGALEIAHLCVAAGADVRHTAVDGTTPLAWASTNGNQEVVALLLSSGGSPTNGASHVYQSTYLSAYMDVSVARADGTTSPSGSRSASPSSFK